MSDSHCTATPISAPQPCLIVTESQNDSGSGVVVGVSEPGREAKSKHAGADAAVTCWVFKSTDVISPPKRLKESIEFHFWLRQGAQGVTLSVCLSVCGAQSALKH